MNDSHSRKHVELLTGAEIMEALYILRSDQNRIPRYASGQEKPFSLREIRNRSGRGTMVTITKWRKRHYDARSISLQKEIAQGNKPSLGTSASAEPSIAESTSAADLQKRIQDLETENVRIEVRHCQLGGRIYRMKLLILGDCHGHYDLVSDACQAAELAQSQLPRMAKSSGA